MLEFPLGLPLDYWVSPDTVQGGLVANMSEDGLCIHSIHPIRIGALLRIRAYFSRNRHRFDSIEGCGKVIWRASHEEADWQGYKYGILLTVMSLRDRERVKRLRNEPQPADTVEGFNQDGVLDWPSAVGGTSM